MTNIIINEKATISAKGKIRNRNAKPIICLETGEVFTSMADAAEKLGVTPANVSGHITGRYKVCKGRHFCLLSEANNHLDQMTANIRYMYERNAELERKAAAYDALMAEQEAKRKAEEEHQAAIEKATAKLEKRRKICERLEAQLQEATAKFMAIERELEMLNAPATA